MIKKTRIFTIMSLFLLSLCLIAGFGNISYAANDDPGAGRLSGDNIPEEFYDNEDITSSSKKRTVPDLRRYGSSSSISPYTNKTYTHHSTFDGRTIINGIDVSQWQKNIDWTKVKAAGIDYAFIRVGYRGYGSAGTLNESTKDTYYDTNMQNAIAAGVNVGIYIFSQAITPDEAREEAQYILNHIGNYNVTMPLIMDYEYASDASDGGRLKKAKLSKDAATSVCMAFCDTIAAAGYTPMVYANKSMLETQLNPSALTAKGYRIWLANYTTNTAYGGDFDFWQYSSEGKVNGITGNVDMNFYYSQPTDNFIKKTSVVDFNSAAVAPISDQPYTGSAIKPAVTVTYGGQPLTQNVDYTVSYSNNKNIGKATVTITGKGIYQGKKSLTFKIIPKTMSAVSIKKRSTNYITLSWKKDSKCTGYQIYRATSLNGSYKKVKNISKNSTTSYKNTKLTSGKCYYYKIRSYKKVNGSYYYGAFSYVKAIYTNTGYTKAALTKPGAAIYNSASTESGVVSTPAANKVLTVTYTTIGDNGSNWLHVSYTSNGTTYKGFVPKSSVTVAKAGKIVKTNVVNVRKSYSTKSKKLTTLKKNQKVSILSTKKKKGVKWYKVTFKKGSKTYTGWISSPYIKVQ